MQAKYVKLKYFAFVCLNVQLFTLTTVVNEVGVTVSEMTTPTPYINHGQSATFGKQYACVYTIHVLLSDSF